MVLRPFQFMLTCAIITTADVTFFLRRYVGYDSVGMYLTVKEHGLKVQRKKGIFEGATFLGDANFEGATFAERHVGEVFKNAVFKGIRQGVEDLAKK